MYGWISKQIAKFKKRSYQAGRPLVICTLGPIYEKLGIIFFPCYKFVCSVIWGLTALTFSFTWVRRKAPPPGPPKYEKSIIFFHILGLNLKMSYQIASLFHMYIDMGERIAGKQDRFSLIIEDPLRAPKIPPKYTFFFIHFQIVTPCCTYVSTVMRSTFVDILVPLVPLDFM